ncbi:MAG: hypothetical protein S4CHLAM123_07050 [Chlamydiales bacterium]|nr:hypothetical protein [Chlamydiales bacterium]
MKKKHFLFVLFIFVISPLYGVDDFALIEDCNQPCVEVMDCNPPCVEVVYCNQPCVEIMDCNQYCCGAMSCNQYCVDIEIAALYWRTCSENRIYGFTEGGMGTGILEDDFKSVGPDNQWGVRVKASYLFNPCIFASTEYTYFDEKSEDRTDDLFTSYFFPNNESASTEANVDICYQRLREVFGLSFLKSHCIDFYGFAGASWLYIKEDDSILATPPPETPPIPSQSLNQTMKFNGAGFELGFGWKYIFCGQFGFEGEINGVAGIGNRSGTAVITSDDSNALVNTNTIPSTTICLPGFDMKLGFVYELSLCCPVCFSIGYEHHQFFNILQGNRLFVTDFFESRNSQIKQDFDMGFGGLFISCGIKY